MNNDMTWANKLTPFQLPEFTNTHHLHHNNCFTYIATWQLVTYMTSRCHVVDRHVVDKFLFKAAFIENNIPFYRPLYSTS